MGFTYNLSVLSLKIASISLQAHIVSETLIRFDNRELLQLMYNHLIWSGLPSSANALANEAGFNTNSHTTPNRQSSKKSVLAVSNKC